MFNLRRPRAKSLVREDLGERSSDDLLRGMESRDDSSSDLYAPPKNNNNSTKTNNNNNNNNKTNLSSSQPASSSSTSSNTTATRPRRHSFTLESQPSFHSVSKDGWGTHVWRTKDRYDGNWKLNKKHGFGVMKWTNGGN